MALKSGTVSRVGIGGSHVVRETSVPRCASHAQLTHSNLSEPAENFSAVHVGDIGSQLRKKEDTGLSNMRGSMYRKGLEHEC